MIKVKFSYEKENEGKQVYKLIQIMDNVFGKGKAKIEHEYKDSNQRSRVHVKIK